MSAAKARSKRSSRSRSGGGTLLGIFIGIMLGALIAAGAAWYFMRANPFQTATMQQTTAQPQTPAAPTGPVALPGRPGGNKVEKPEFDFYKMLPQGEGAGRAQNPAPTAPPAPDQAAKLQQQQAQMQAEQQQKIAAAILEGKTPPAQAEARPAPSEKFFLQVGAFGSVDEADNLKARLAFMGIESSSQRVDTPDKGTLNRVRVGPFKSPEDMNRVRAELAQAGIPASVVKVGP